MRKQPLRLSAVRSSNLHGYWKRLKRHGFKPGKEWSILYTRDGSPYTYIRTFWTFTRKSEKLLFALSVHGYRMKVTRGKSVMLDMTMRCWSHFERPFLKYFDDTRPLEIRRLGKQTKAVSIWLQARDLKEQKRISEERRKAREKKVGEMTMTFPVWMLPLAVVLALFMYVDGFNSPELTMLIAAVSTCYVVAYFLRESENPYLRFTPFYMVMVLAATVGAMYHIRWLFLGPLGITALHLVAVWIARGDED